MGRADLKNIIITGGPTNEFIDEVMKITNMSTGSLSIALAHQFLIKEYNVTLILNRSVSTQVLNEYLDGDFLTINTVETTEDMLDSLYGLANNGTIYDIVIHAAAVGDYKADFTFLMEDLAHELYLAFEDGKFSNKEQILAYLMEGSYRVDNQSKISSYQDTLTVKLGLTPKIIKNLKNWFPTSILVGCKLLDKVSKKELFEVAEGLAKKNNMDYILANDLNDLRQGKLSRYLVNTNGYMGIELSSPEEICNYFHERI